MNSIAQKYHYIMEKTATLCYNKALTALLFLVYKLLLDIIYLKCIGNTYSYFWVYKSSTNAVNGWLVSIIMAVLFSRHYEKKAPSDIMMIVFDLFYFVPMTTYCAYGGGSTSFLFWGIIYWFLLTLLQFKVPLVTLKNSTGKKSGKTIYVMIAAVSVPILYVWVRFAHMRLLLDYRIIYDARAEAAAYEIPIILRYLLNMAPIVIGILIVLSISQRKYLSVLYLLGLTFIDFSIAGNKTTIFFPALLIGGFLLYRNELVSLILPGGIILELIALLDFVFGKKIIVTLVFRRMGLMLAQLSEVFYRFFRNNSIDFFRQGILGKLGFDTIYSQNIANVIGNNYETQGVNCNNGLMADVWANMGVIGIFVMPVVLIFCMRLLDFMAYRIDQRMLIGIIVYYAFAFANAQWSTVLLTHGYLLMCILLLFIPKDVNISLRTKQKGSQ